MLKARTCPLCEATCGLLVDVIDDRLESVRGNPANAFSQGYLCAKGASLNQIESDPDRVRRPLLRRGDDFAPVTWDDAFSDIADHLGPIIGRHGADAVGMYVGNANHASDNFFLEVLHGLIGTRHVFTSGTVDQIPRQLASCLMYGVGTSVPVPDIDSCSYLVVIGGNPAVSNGSLFTVPNFAGRVRDLRARGGTLVVIDPRRTATADLADEHLAIRPGTDSMLLLGLVKVLTGERSVDLGPVGEHLAGTDTLAQLAGSVELADVERVTNVPVAVIRRLAADLAGANGGAVYGRIGTTTQRFGTVASYLIDCVNILSGNLDRRGGAMFPKAAVGATNTVPYHGEPTPVPAFGEFDRFGQYRQIHAGGFVEFPVVSLPRMILQPGEGQLRAMVVIGANPARTAPDSAMMTAAMKSLDYLVSIDRYVNETSSLANVILPAPRLLTKSQYDAYFYQYAYRNFACYSPPLVELLPDELPEWQVYLRLGAIAAGLGKDADIDAIEDNVVTQLVQQIAENPASAIHGRHLPDVLDELSRWHGPERLLDLLLRTGPYGDGFGSRPGLTLDELAAHPDGIDLGPLTPRIPEILRTRSLKIDLAAPELIQATRSMVEHFRFWSPPPLSLIGRRNARSVNSWTHNIPRLIGGSNRCTLEVNQADARENNIADGDRVSISTGVNSVIGVVEISDRVPAGVVSAPFGWGHDADRTDTPVASKYPGFNINQVIPSDAVDELSGTAALNAVPVEIVSAENPNSA